MEARVHTRERAGKLVGNNESIFQTVENGLPCQPLEAKLVVVWPMNFNARPNNNKGAFIGQFLANGLGGRANPRACTETNH